MTFVRVALVAMACLVGVAAPASAAPAWLAPVEVSGPDQSAFGLQVAVDGQGNAIAVWYRSDGVVQAAVRAAGGSWEAPENLSAAGGNASAPQVAVDGQGNAVAVWRHFDGADFIVQAAVRAVGGGWEAPVDLSAAGQDADLPQVAVDGQGNAVAVWWRSDGADFIVQAAVRAVGGAWEPPVDLSAAGQPAFGPQVAVDGQGNAVAVWYRFDGARYVVQAAVRAAGGGWEAPVDLSAAGQHAVGPQVAVDGQGNAVAVWRRNNGMRFVVQAAVRAAGGAWEAPADLSVGHTGQDALSPQVAVDGQGNAVAVWYRSDDANSIVQAAVRAAGGAWEAPVDLSATGPPDHDASHPQVAVDGQGNAVAVWHRYSGAQWVVQAAARAASGAWSAPANVSAAGQNGEFPQVAADVQGNAVAVWRRSDGAPSRAQAAGFDAAGPLLNGLSVPGSGVAGQPVSLSVSPFDWWSPLGATAWTFGDGATASGTGVTHTYANAGSYTVGVDAADVLGNTTTATRTITIAPASTSPPPPGPGPGSAASPGDLITAGLTGRGVCVGRRAKGVTAMFALSRAARVTFTLERKISRFPAFRRCPRVARGPQVEWDRVSSESSDASAGPGSQTVARASSRRRVRRVASVSRRLGAGPVRARLSQLLDGRRLSPGTYRLRLDAVDADGVRDTGAPLFFWVLRPPAR